MRNFKLLGPQDEMPVFERHSFNITQQTKNRCIVVFASYNDSELKKVHTLLSELKEKGYSGHVLLRVGGFPNTQNGGLKLCHVPYAFKVAFLQEARALGYREVLWLDATIHPLTDLEMIFAEIERNGYFFTSLGSLQDNALFNRPEAAKTMGVSTSMYERIPHFSSLIFGLDMKNDKAFQFLTDWHTETQRVYPYLTFYPEELSLSVVAWRLQCKPFSWFGTIVCLEDEVSWLLPQRPTIQAYLDSRK
jgi:hypothetical protein